MILSAKEKRKLEKRNEKREGLKGEMVGTELIKSTMEINITAYKMVKWQAKLRGFERGS